MPDYETLDVIADAYTPLLALGCIGFLLQPLAKLHLRLLVTRMARIFAGALVAYGLMFLDHWLQPWPAMGLDYSTHTAVALVLVMFLSTHSRQTRWVWPASLVGYALLMMYQRYHTLADIVTTAIVVGLLYLPVVFPLFRNHRLP